MPATLVGIRNALTKERRTNRRLRAIIDDLRDQVRNNRRDIDMQFKRIAQIQAELDVLKKPRRKTRTD
jgi:hypothetical protein